MTPLNHFSARDARAKLKAAEEEEEEEEARKASCHPWSDNETKPVNHNAALPPLLQRVDFLERQTPLKGTMIAGVGYATVLSFSFT